LEKKNHDFYFRYNSRKTQEQKDREIDIMYYLYQVPGSTDNPVPYPTGFVQCGPQSEKCKNDVIQTYNIAQALSLSIREQA